MNVERPARDRIPYEEIAEIVRTWPTRSGYGRHIAGKYGVPFTTAQRWIRVARQRGLLPPGTEDRPCRWCGGSGRVSWRKR